MRCIVVGLAIVLALGPGCSCGGTLTPRTGDGSIPRDGNGFDLGSPTDAYVAPHDIVIIAPGTPSDAATHFGDPSDADAAHAPNLLYPLDQVQFPRNVWSPDVQWDDPGVMGDLYRVRFAGAPVTLTTYLVHTGTGFRWDYQPDETSWRMLSAGAAGRTMTLEVDRWIAATHQVAHGNTITLRIASEGIAGAVYYWRLGSFAATEGRVIRVRQGGVVAPAIEDFMPMPPPGNDGVRCAACHGLSRDGNHLAVSLRDGQFGGVFDLNEDLTVAMPPMVFRFSSPWYFAAFNPDASRVVMTDPSQHTHLLDGRSGTEITTLPDGTHPAWSPDGHQLALIVNADDAWNPTHGDLVTIAVNTGDTFAAPSMLHTGASLTSAPEGGSLDAYPSYSPDSTFLAFGHGTHTLLSAAGAAGALYLVTTSGGVPRRLDHASIGNAYYPSFTPFITSVDEINRTYWLLHYSPRDYGNQYAGTRGSHRRQIWVSAISPVGAGDPSSVPYWLPGQEVDQQNASAFWAPLPCRGVGGQCFSGSQCCSAACVSNACAPPADCRHEGDTCSTDADCCTPGLSCVGGACVPVAPM
jgi:hypothetical protein